MEVIDKGIDPANPTECILEVNMSEQEAAQVEVLAAKSGCSMEDWVIQVLTKAVTDPEGFIKLCVTNPIQEKSE